MFGSDKGTRVNILGLVGNLGLAVGKLWIGTLANSAALVADGFNSTGDVLGTLIATVGYKEGQRPADETHPFGYGNAEAIAGILVSAIVFATGCFIVLEGVLSVVRDEPERPDVAAVIMGLVTIWVKEGLYQVTSRVGRSLNSPAILASARDHRADVFAGGAVLIGILGARFGFPILDPIVAVGIGIFVAYYALEPLRDNVATLMDRADPAIAEEIRLVARGVEEVREADSIRVHPLGAYMVVDMEIYVSGDLSLHAAHDVAHRVSEQVLAQVEHVRDVRVHVNPTGEA